MHKRLVTTQTPQRRRWRLAALLIALQIAFCTGVYWIEHVSEQIDGRPVADVLVADSEIASLHSVAFKAVRLAGETCCDAPGAHIRTTLTAADTESPSPAILLVSAYDNATIYVGGVLIAAQGHMGRAPSNFSGRPLLVRVPRALATPGAPVDILVQRAVGAAHLRPFFVGDYDRLYPSYVALRAVRFDLLFMNAAFGAFLAGLTFCAAPLFRTRSLLWSLSALGASWTLQHVSLLMTDPPWGGVANSGVYYFGFLATVLSAIWFFIEWTSSFERAPPQRGLRALAFEPWPQGARTRLALAIGVILAAAGGLIAYRLSFDLLGASHAINVWISWLGLFAMAFCLVRLAAYYRRVGLDNPIEASAFIFVLVAAIADLIAVRFFDSTSVLLGAAVTFFPLALLVSLAARARAIFEAATANAEKLNALVSEREGQIRESLTELQRRERESVLTEERSRIMRDMHDGIGGQLLGLVLRARANTLSGESLVQGLEESLADLRVVVDSLEQGEGSLATTLGAFRARIEPRVEAAGARLIWQIDDPGDAPAFGPDRALQLYRILQEACTNALKHGNPTRVEVTLRRSASGKVELSVADDGRGFQPDAAARGRGLANMRHRAAHLGVTLRLESSAGGTRVTLEL